MSVSTFIARRYLNSKKSSSAVGIISLVSIFGVGVAVFALFVVLSVFSALRQMNVSYLSLMDPDIRVSATEGKFFEGTDDLKQKILSSSAVEQLSFVVEDKVFVTYGDKQIVAFVKGVDNFYSQVIDVDTLLSSGAWLSGYGKDEAVVGAKIAYDLELGGATEYIPVTLYVPTGESSLSLSSENLFKSTDIEPVGVFSYREYDGTHIFTRIDKVREFFSLSQYGASYAELKLKSGADADKTAEELGAALGEKFSVTTRAQQQQMYFKIVNTENIVLYSVFTIVLLIAMFNVVGSVVMLIIDKRSDISTLHSMGAEMSVIKKIFLKEGMMIVLLGGCSGLILGVGLVLIQQYFPFVRMNTGAMLAYPILFTFENLVLVLITIVVLAYGCARASVMGMKNILANK